MKTGRYIYKLGSDEELTLTELQRFLVLHDKEVNKRLRPLWQAYMTDYKIFRQAAKPDWKPDNRIAVNFAKYIVDTMNGFFLGNPIKVLSDDEAVAAYIEFLDGYNDQDDNNAELAKLCDIFGRGYELYFVDDDANIGITYVSPMDAFMIFDDSILERPRYFVRTYRDRNNVLHGSISDDKEVKYFVRDPALHWEKENREEGQPHGFDGVPATEYRENEEGLGLFEPVISMIDAFNKALSEKANDVDYFADAYLKILGARLDNETIKDIRSNRIINFKGEGVDKLIVEFLQKPDGDTSQEHLIDRLQQLIFQISMVANLSDENFGSTTGIALKYKLQAMSNLAKTKERKFTSGMNRRYKLIFSNPQSKMNADDWVHLKYQFTLNYPSNDLEESQIAGNLSGIVSRETQLKTLSVVDNVKEELDRIEAEEDREGYETDYPTNRTATQDDEAGQEENEE